VRTLLALSLSLVASVGACRLPQRSAAEIGDPFLRAEAARERGDLTLALCAFDEVEPRDPRYAQARLQAAALEQRLRRHQELTLQGLRLRAEWRCDEAIAAFLEAQRAWPEDERTRQLLIATESRRAAARNDADSTSIARDAKAIDAQPQAVAVDATRADADSSAAISPVPMAEGELNAPRAADPVGAQLARLEARLQRGQLDSVLTEMFALHRQWPSDARVCGRLARLLLQRGLVHYGRGAIEVAVEDWRRARQLDPQLASVAQLLDSASRELSQPPR
jgi:tetratricopeptide (TPR) repeat protein